MNVLNCVIGVIAATNDQLSADKPGARRSTGPSGRASGDVLPMIVRARNCDGSQSSQKYGPFRLGNDGGDGSGYDRRPRQSATLTRAVLEGSCASLHDVGGRRTVGDTRTN